MRKDSKRVITTFALASFLNDFGSDIIYPIWPLFVTTVLHGNMAVLGFIDGLGEAIVSISQAVSGYLSDRWGKRKPFIWVGYLCGSLSRIGYALSASWPMLIPFRGLDRTGKMRGAPRDAILADISTKENRGRNFGLLRAMDNLGAVCGIMVAILLLKSLGYRNLFLLAAIPSVVGALLILALIKETKPSGNGIYKGLRIRDLDSNFRMFIVLSSVFALGSFSYSFLLIYAKSFGFGEAIVPVLYLLFTALAFAFSLPFGKLSDKIGRKPVLMIAYILWGLTLLSFILLRGCRAAVTAIVLYGLHRGALDPVQKTLVAELAPAEYRASGLGGFQMVTGLCALPASFIAGMLWDKIGILIPCYFSISLTVLALVMLVFVKES